MLYEITTRESYQGQVCINTFHYNSAGTPAAVSGAFALASVFGAIPQESDGFLPSGTPLGEMIYIQSVNLALLETEVMALYDDVDFYTVPYSPVLIGSRAGEGLAPFNAFGFYSSRVNRAIRRGFKRLAGVAESSSGAGGVLTSQGVTDTNTVAGQFSRVLTYSDEGNSLTFSPVVLSYEKYTTPSGKTAYRPWPSLAVQVTHMAQGIAYVPYTNVRSQTSRQVGRGS